MSDPKATARKSAPFAAVARAALEKHVPEARTAEAVWGSRTNLVWVRWRRGDGFNAHLGLRRHLGWVTGEAALSVGRDEMDRLPLRAGGEDETACFRARGYRVRLGEILHEEDRWWPAGTTPDDLRQTLEWIVLQLRVKADGYFLRHPVQ
jgi:hypothetical protein